MSVQHLERVQAIFDELFIDKVNVTPQLSAKDVEEWDSLMQVSLIIKVEQTFGVVFRTGELAGLRNVGDLLELIDKRLHEH